MPLTIDFNNPLFPFLFCSLAMNLARRPGTVVTDDTVMTFWPDCASSFLSSFLLHNLRQTPRLEFPARNGLSFFPFPNRGV
jgi:hypothetical protein